MSRVKLTRLLASLVALCLVVPASWATQGSFRGTVVRVPDGQPSAGYLYLQSKKGGVRKVEISKADVVFDPAVQTTPAPKGQAKDNLKPGAEVRVIAEQSNDGEWHASRIEIVTDDVKPQADADSETGMQSATSDDDGTIQYAPDQSFGQGSIRRI